MHLNRISISHLRNLTQVTLEPGAGLNQVVGPNGAGKTALLEAIFLLARARSFRTPRLDDVIQHGQPRLTVRAEVEYDGGERLVIGLERGEGKLVLRRDGENVSAISAHARVFPLVVLTPESQQLVSGGPSVRREWLDWAMFHVEPAYLDHWRAYFRAMRHRNQLLREGAPAGRFAPWEAAMHAHGLALHEARESFLEDVAPAAQRLAREIGVSIPEISLVPGWDASEPLEVVLARTRAADMGRGHSSLGPHRADVVFHRDGSQAGAVLSRGESKQFVVILLLAEAEVRAARQEEKPVLLLDDFGAELDAAGQERVLSLLAESGAQAFLTSTQRLGERSGEADALFHVERGEFAKMIE
jgi:DNA replication and repair protein RecF